MPQVTECARRAIWETLLLRSTNGKLSHGQLTQTAQEFDVERRVVSRIWDRWISSMGFRVAAVIKSRASARGRKKKKDQVAMCKDLRSLDMLTRTNQRVLQVAARISAYMLQQLIKEGYMRHALKQTRALLTSDHELERVRWSLRHVVPLGPGDRSVFDPMYDVVHIDEKWFYVKRVGEKVYVITDEDGKPAETPPVQFVKSKRFIMKVMFLCALVIDKVIPAIKSKWPAHEKHMGIRIQLDNASPHVEANDSEVLAAGREDGWRIIIDCQPAQSPDLNVIDLGYFNSIQSLQNRCLPASPEALIEEVMRAFSETTATTLNNTFTFLTLQFVMEHIMFHGGRNDFRLGHLRNKSATNWRTADDS
ncbi:hypothetical protein ATCC90586_009234 [Pythium insidiosum]|nr:hypothetical protein ATCC90586_009234 [Pythium insidiosum]